MERGEGGEHLVLPVALPVVISLSLSRVSNGLKRMQAKWAMPRCPPHPFGNTPLRLFAKSFKGGGGGGGNKATAAGKKGFFC